MKKLLLLSFTCLFSGVLALHAQNFLQGGDLEIVKTGPAGVADLPGNQFISSADVAAVYSNVSTSSGMGNINGGAALTGSNTVTAIVADSLGLSISAPCTIGRFLFSIANYNSVAVVSRPRVVFYQNNGTNTPDGPGTVLAAFSFNSVNVAANAVITVTGTATVNIPAGATGVWAGLFFDNNNGAAPATMAQLNNMGQGIYNPVDVGASTNTLFRTAAAASTPAANPAGTVFTVGGTIAANAGWELREASSVLSVVRNDASPHLASGTISWNVTFAKPMAGVNASNFSLALSGISAYIASVTAITSTVWKVTANINSGTAGSAGLNVVNQTAMNTTLTNLPATGQVYIINNVLPVKIEYFRGAKSGDAHQLSWKVNCENTLSASMAVERKNPDGNYATLFTVTADATRCLQEFFILDDKPLSGINYYRLKVTDRAGKSATSNVIALLNKKSGLSLAGIYPNPAPGNINLQIAAVTPGKIDITVRDSRGSIVLQSTKAITTGANTVTLMTQYLSAGNYFVSAIFGNDNLGTVSFLKQ